MHYYCQFFVKTSMTEMTWIGLRITSFLDFHTQVAIFFKCLNIFLEKVPRNSSLMTEIKINVTIKNIFWTHFEAHDNLFWTLYAKIFIESTRSRH